MSHLKCIVLFLTVVAMVTNESHGRSLDRTVRDVVADGVEVDLSVSGEDNRAAIPVISDIMRVEKIADLLISIGERVLPALLDGLAEQVTTAAERKLKPAGQHTEKTSHESILS
ncbi:uncharacterized protein LOC131289694 [Anopheles ziemanni]|uniref:uncharacterized protein LOC131260570 n=1 Tax=Anopheles coustani TaxID=139045 RepID=UPI0026594155|nr:uncharacterized protein LOC131260570 [Anopheles coustani]XP_058174975.1 uncharacterized protein LOC131289694 [Anopheles ziemanni]